LIVDDGDARRKPHCDRIRDIFDKGAKPEKPKREQDQTGEHRGKDEAVHAVPLDGRRDEHDERARRAADLESTTA
jgi:hypothetical protein